MPRNEAEVVPQAVMEEILRKALKPPLIAAFAGIVATGILLVGCAANVFTPILATEAEIGAQAGAQVISINYPRPCSLLLQLRHQGFRQR